jgi:hypothetical protein
MPTRTHTTRRGGNVARLYSALQTARRARGWDDATYYSRLGSIVGRCIASTAELSRAEAARCLDDINGAARHRPRPGGGPDTDDSRSALVDEILRRLAVLVGEDGQRLTLRYAEAILRRQRGMHGLSVATPITTATPAELRAVLAALDTYARRNPDRVVQHEA